jgi:release factor glutamine methyltransferase
VSAARDTRVELWRERLSAGLHLLPDKPEETVESTLRALWLTACGFPVSAVRAAALTALPELDPGAELKLAALVDERIRGTPLAHLTGRQSFLGLEMLAGAGALIPRRETELLARSALEVLASTELSDEAPLVIDTCTGCGNVALAVAAGCAGARVLAADLSPEAVELARRNAEHLGLAERVAFRAGDLLAPFDEPQVVGRVTLITCNPPYISTARVGVMDREIHEHEPRLAFDGGPLGIRILARLLNEAPRFLRPGGRLCFEVGAGQGPGMAMRVEASGAFDSVRTISDDGGIPRVIVARRPPSPA